MGSAEQQRAAGELAHAVVAHLKDWTVDVPAEHWGVYLVHKTGARVFVSVNRYRLEGRAEFTGSAPRMRDGSSAYASSFRGGLGHHRVTCDAKRPPAAIAKDLERRLLPAFLADWDAANEAVRRTAVAEDELGQVADRLAAVVGGRRSAERRRRLADGVTIYAPHDEVERLVVHGERPSIDGHRGIGVELRLRDVSPPTAVEILRMLDEDRARRSSALRQPRLDDDDRDAEAVSPDADGADVGADDVKRQSA
jgi:hypothetical protein